MSIANDIDSGLRSILAGIASGVSLDEALQAIAGRVSERLGAGACKIWLVKQGDVCSTCALAAACQDRSMCLHLKASIPGLAAESPRVPLVVFRERAAARGGCGRVHDAGAAGRLLFGAETADGPGPEAYALEPLKGPAGVLGLIGLLRDAPLATDELEVLHGFAYAAVAAVRIGDLTSRYQRATMRIEEGAEERAEVGGLLHSILYGSTEYNVIAEDLVGNITLFSEGARHAYGYAPEDVINRAKADILYAPEEIESGKIVEILAETMRTGSCESVVARMRKNGERFPARATFTIRRDADGDPAGFVIVERDLSNERNSARLTETAAIQVAQMQEHLHDLRSAHGLLEVEVAKLREENAALKDQAERVRELEELTSIRVATIRDLREKAAALATENRALRDAGESVDAERRALEAENARLRAEAAEAPRPSGAEPPAPVPSMRALVDVAHELRSPLSAILGIASLLGEDESLPERHRDGLGRVERNARELLLMVNNALDSARLDADRMEVFAAPVDLADVIAGARAAVDPLAAARGVPILVEIAPGMPAVTTDRDKVRRILVNLLSNAVKFTPVGKISVAASAEGGEVAIRVTDTGVGIAEADLTAIFDEFRQGRSSAAAEAGAHGAGLGLAISRRLARLLGGDLTVESRVGWGSTFTLSLPAGAAHGPARAEASDVVLVSNADEALLVADALRDAGRDGVLFDSGERAVAFAHRARPSLAVVDVDAPGGWGALDGLLRVPGMTAVAVGAPQSRGRALAKRAFAFVARPLARSALDRAIARAVAGACTKVLLVDDDADSRAVLHGMLEHPGIELVEASSGNEALASARVARPDALVLDLCMPDGSGFDVLAVLKGLPVALVTAKDLSGEDRRRLAGASAVLQKGSFNREELLAEIDRMVETWQSQS